MEGKKPEDTPTEILPGSLSNTLEEQVFPTLNSLGTVSPENVEVYVKVRFPDQEQQAILRWDYQRGPRLRISGDEENVINQKGKKYVKTKKTVIWETVGNISENVIGRAIKGATKGGE